MSVRNSEKSNEIYSYILDSVLDVFEGDVICFLIHGSLVKGGLIEGFSDLDVQVFLKESSFDEFGLKLEKCMEIQKSVGELNLSKIGAQYLQMYFHNPKNMPDWYTPPFKGSYKILHGELPDELDFDTENFRMRMIKSLKSLRIEVRNTIRNFADSSNKTVYRRTRLIATKIYPIMYSLLSYDLINPVDIWTKTKFEVLELFRQKYKNKAISNYLTRFFTKIELLAVDRSNLKLTKEAFSNGVNFLKEATIIGEGIEI